MWFNHSTFSSRLFFAALVICAATSDASSQDSRRSSEQYAAWYQKLPVILTHSHIDPFVERGRDARKDWDGAVANALELMDENGVGGHETEFTAKNLRDILMDKTLKDFPIDVWSSGEGQEAFIEYLRNAHKQWASGSERPYEVVSALSNFLIKMASFGEDFKSRNAFFHRTEGPHGTFFPHPREFQDLIDELKVNPKVGPKETDKLVDDLKSGYISSEWGLQIIADVFNIKVEILGPRSMGRKRGRGGGALGEEVPSGEEEVLAQEEEKLSQGTM